MFEIGWSELLIIGMVAILVVPPKDLPVLMRTIGKYMGQLRRMAGEFRSQFDDAMRDAEIKELQDQLRNEARAIEKLNPMSDAENSINDSFKKLEASTAPPTAAAVSLPAAAEAQPAPVEIAAAEAPVDVAVLAPMPAAETVAEPVPVETADQPARPSVAERAAQAWKKAAGADSGA